MAEGGGLHGALSQLLRSRSRVALSLVLALALLAGGSVGVLIRLGQWPPTFASSQPALVITRPETATPGILRASVLGAVLSPGVNPLAEGARVRNLIEAAGGARANADLSRLDVTAALRDGQTVYVPQVGETPLLLVGGNINLNIATALQLHDALGISSAVGKRIVSYREKHGRYSAVSDLLLVPVGQTIYNRILLLSPQSRPEYITVRLALDVA